MDADMKSIEREIKSLHTLRYENIIKLYALVSDQSGEVGLLLELAPAGSLRYQLA